MARIACALRIVSVFVKYLGTDWCYRVEGSLSKLTPRISRNPGSLLSSIPERQALGCSPERSGTLGPYATGA
jgi:hypothetical protein